MNIHALKLSVMFDKLIVYKSLPWRNMNALQLDFTVDKSPVNPEEAYLMRLEMKKTQEMSHNVRRGIFARLSEQEKLVLSLREEIEQMRAIINEFKEAVCLK